MNAITDCRSRRTKRSNEIRRQIVYMLTAAAPYRSPDGLPSWWPFWSDALKDNVRAIVRTAIELETLEQR